MGKYYLTDGTCLYGTGECQDGMEDQMGFGRLTSVAGNPPDNLPCPAPPEPSYRKQRSEAYPDVGQQLDALWHAMQDGTLPKAEPFFSSILAVKQRFPKPSN